MSAPGHTIVRDVTVTIFGFVLAGIVGAFVWWQVVTPPYAIRVGNHLVTSEKELAVRPDMDFWYVVVAAGLTVLTGVVVAWLCDVDERLTLVLGTVAAFGAALLMWHLGSALGSSDVNALAARAPNGGHVPEPLGLTAQRTFGESLPFVLFVWPMVFVLTHLATLVLFPGRGTRVPVRTPAEAAQRPHL